MYIPARFLPSPSGHKQHENQYHQSQELFQGNGGNVDAQAMQHLSLWNNGNGPLQCMQRHLAYRVFAQPLSKRGEAKQALLHEDCLSIDVSPPRNLSQLKIAALLADARKTGDPPEVRVPLTWDTLVEMIDCPAPAKWDKLHILHCVPTRMGVDGMDGVDFALEMWATGADGVSVRLHPETRSMWIPNKVRSMYRFPCGNAQYVHVPLVHDPETAFTHVSSQFSMPPRQVLTEEEFNTWAETTRAVVAGGDIVLTCDRPSHSQVYIPDIVTRAVYAHGDMLHKQWISDGHPRWKWQGRCPTTKRDATLILCSSSAIKDILCGRYPVQPPTASQTPDNSESASGLGHDVHGDLLTRVEHVNNLRGVVMKPGSVLELRVKDCHRSLFEYERSTPNAQMQLTLEIAVAYVAHGAAMHQHTPAADAQVLQIQQG